MEQVPKLHQCFRILNEQLFQIEHNLLQRTTDFKEMAVNEILYDAIFGFDPEDAQSALLAYIQKVEYLKQNLQQLIDGLEIQDRIEKGENIFDRVVVSSDEIRSQLMEDTGKELDYYSNKLNDLLNAIEDNIDRLGTNRFANAGFKLTLDLTNEEIGAFFNALYELQIIKVQNPNGQLLSKTELANFIIRNFSSKTTDSIASKSMRNKLSNKDPAAEKKIAEEFIKLATFLNS